LILPCYDRDGLTGRSSLTDLIKKAGRYSEVHIKNIKLAENVDVPEIAAMTAGFAGADLANLVNEATLLAVREVKMR